MGSEEFIRLQFEEYLLALLSSVSYHMYLENPYNSPLPSIDGDPSNDFNSDWIHAWRQTSSFALFASHTDAHLFDFVEPRHPTAGNLSIEDIQRRLTLQIQTLHLDERLASSKEALNKHFASGQKKVSTAFTNLWADIEALREAQRKRAEAASLPVNNEVPPNGASANSSSNHSSDLSRSHSASSRFSPRAPDLSAAQASVTAASQKAGAYISSWGVWASERRRGWGRSSMGHSSDEQAPSPTPSPAPGGKFHDKATGDGGHGLNGSGSGNGGTRNAGSKRNGRVEKEEKGGDGIGRLDA